MKTRPMTLIEAATRSDEEAPHHRRIAEYRQYEQMRNEKQKWIAGVKWEDVGQTVSLDELSRAKLELELICQSLREREAGVTASREFLATPPILPEIPEQPNEQPLTTWESLRPFLPKGW